MNQLRSSAIIAINCNQYQNPRHTDKLIKSRNNVGQQISGKIRTFITLKSFVQLIYMLN